MKLSEIIHERIAKWRPIRIIELLSWAHQSEDNERRIAQLEVELERIICHWCEEGVTEAEANEHYKSCTKNPLRAENEAYHELILEVANKYPGETRHETALRYIRERENQEQRVAMSAEHKNDS